MATEDQGWLQRTLQDASRRNPLLTRPSALLRTLATVINDRQPSAEKQTPETEWRRQRDLSASIGTIRDVLKATIHLLEGAGPTIVALQDALSDPSGDPDDPVEPGDAAGANLTRMRAAAAAVSRQAQDAIGQLLLLRPAVHGLGEGLDRLSVYVDTADDATLAAANAYTDTQLLGYIKVDGTRAFTGDQSMGGNKLTSLGTPTLNDDAVTKLYCDTGDSSTLTSANAFTTAQLNNYVAKSVFTTKGDIIAATGASAPARVGVGANGTVLTADSTQASGVKWAIAPSAGSLVLTQVTVTLSSTPEYSGTFTITGVGFSVGAAVIVVYVPADDEGEMVGFMLSASVDSTTSITVYWSVPASDGPVSGDYTFGYAVSS